MPLPTPNPDEEKDKFIDRCMENKTMNDDFPDQAQRRAVCEKQWDGEGAQAILQPKDYPSIVNAVFNQPWAITSEMYGVICELVRSRALGFRLTTEQIQERIGARHVRDGIAKNGAVAVLPLYGVLAQRMNMMTEISGGTSTEMFTKALRTVLKEPAISAIVIDVDSPGGSVFGIGELASEMLASRGTKPIIAVANSMAASAAYWIASQADELVVTPGGIVGSIGVLTAHEDMSKAEEMAGIKTTIVSAGKFKSEAASSAPLSAEARDALQSLVDDYYAAFVEAVAKGRGTSIAKVKGGFGQGRLVNAEDALAEGMVDRIATLDQTIARLIGRDPQGLIKAEADTDFRQRRLRMASH